MTIYTEDQALEEIADSLDVNDLMETDNQGQIVIYTNLYRWNDDSIRTEPDPNFDC